VARRQLRVPAPGAVQKKEVGDIESKRPLHYHPPCAFCEKRRKYCANIADSVPMEIGGKPSDRIMIAASLPIQRAPFCHHVCSDGLFPGGSAQDPGCREPAGGRSPSLVRGAVCAVFKRKRPLARSSSNVMRGVRALARMSVTLMCAPLSVAGSGIERDKT